MPYQYRSRRARLAAMTERLRAEGWSWAQIAERIAREERLNMRVAVRLAHGWSQAQVASLWNQQWPGHEGRSGITDKTISYWETWPQSGHEPSLKTLKRLAQLYQCDVGDLIDDGKYSHLDQARHALHPPGHAEQAVSSQVALLPARTSHFPHKLAPLAVMLGDPQHPGVSGRWAGVLDRLLHLARERDGSPLEREALYEELVRLLASWADSMKRRELLRMVGWAATVAAAPPLFPGLNADEQERLVRVLGHHHRVDEPVIRHIESVLWSAMRQDDTLGPQAALDTVLAQRNLVRAVLPECPLRLRPRVLSLFSNLSRFAGWLSFDLSDFDTAAYYYEHARTAAHEAQNTELGVFVLCNMSHLATWRGQPRVGIDHAVAAQGWVREASDMMLRAYVADVAARAYATAGMRQQCLDALASIQGNLDATTRTPAASLVYFYGPGQYANTRAQCLLLLSDTSHAVEAAREAVTRIDGSFVRNQAFSTLHLGNAYIESGEITEAARTIGEGAALAARNRSPRVITTLHDSRARLGRWQRTKAVRELDERLASYGWAHNSTT